MVYKILFLSSWFPNKLEPTNGNFVQRHAEAVALLHDVEILHAIGDFNQLEKFVFDDKTVNGIRTLIVYYRNSKNPLQNFLRRMRAYKKGFKKMNFPDIVHANILHNNMLFAVYLKKKFKIPFVVSEHWSGFLKVNRSRLSRKALFIAKKIATQATMVLPVSKYLENDLRELSVSNSLKVIENVVDTRLFQVKEGLKNQFVFLHVSNLVKLKNPEAIMTAAKILHKEYPHFELHIGGDGDTKKLTHWVHTNRAQNFIHVFPTLTQKEVAEKMRDSSCFVLFSDYENFPCVLLESLSSGTPVIATDVGGVSEIVDHKNGILIPNSEDELYHAMKKMLIEPNFFEKPGILHDKMEKKFSPPVIAAKFDEVYRQVLER